MALLRLSRRAGLIEVGTQPTRCMCAPRELWTANGGATWHPTTAPGDLFTGAGDTVYWWQRGSLHRISGFPPTAGQAPPRTQLLASVPDGTIVAAKPVPGGVVALVSSRVDGHHYDTTPRLLIVRGGTQTVRLPAQTGRILAQRLQVSWPRLTVTGTDFAPDPVRTVTWTSADGGVTWSTG